jgi:hypothetical protein
MFAVIFEVQPIKEQRNQYFGLTKSLKPTLDAIDGFLDIDPRPTITAFGKKGRGEIFDD